MFIVHYYDTINQIATFVGSSGVCRALCTPGTRENTLNDGWQRKINRIKRFL